MFLINPEIANRLHFPQQRKEEMARARKALINPVKLDSQQLIESWVVIGECHKFDMESQLCEMAYLKALEVIRTSGSDELLGQGYEALGDALHFCKDYTRAITYYRQAAEIFERLDEIEQLIVTLSQIAYSYAEMGQRKEEMRHLNVAILQPTIQPLMKATLLERVALSLSASSEYEEAIRVYEQALSIFEFEGFKRHWHKRLQCLAQLYSEIGDEEAVKRTLERL